jgi:hypothetical protein
MQGVRVMRHDRAGSCAFVALLAERARIRRAEQDRSISRNSGQDATSCPGASSDGRSMAPHRERNEDISKRQLTIAAGLIRVLGGRWKTYDRPDLRASD